MNNLTDNRLQVTEIYQVAGNKLTAFERVCQMPSAKLLSNDTCYLLNERLEGASNG